MKRKLEKYTSKKQGVPLHRLQLLDDGRFDFKTDEIDAIISALREYSSCKKPRNASKANSDSPSTPHPQPMSMVHQWRECQDRIQQQRPHLTKLLHNQPLLQLMDQCWTWAVSKYLNIRMLPLQILWQRCRLLRSRLIFPL
jgi:hypothetical protein